MLILQREGHGAGALGGLHGPDGLGHPQVHQPGAAPKRGGSRKIRRAGVAHGAARHQHLAEGALVAVGPPRGQGRPDKVPLHGLGPADKAPDQVMGNADVDHLHFSGIQGTIPHRLPDLGQGEGHGPLRPDGGAQNAACVRLHTAGNIGSRHGPPPPVHPVDGGGPGTVRGDGPAEAHAEQSVHTHVRPQHEAPLTGVRRVEGLQLHAALTEAARLLQGVRGQLFVAAHQEDPDPDAL